MKSIEYTNIILQNIFIKFFYSVDYLICHSGATFPGLLLCLEDHSKIKALCLLNPGSFNVKAMRYF